MHSITSGIGTEFHPVEDALRNVFLLSLFKGATSQITGRELTGMPSKQTGIALSDPTQTAGANWMVSCVITGHLVAALHRTDEFLSGDHALLMVKGRYDIGWRHDEATKTALGEAWAAASAEDAHQTGYITRMGEWLSVLPSTVNVMELRAQEWRYSFFLRYSIDPTNLPEPCDGYGVAFDICHTIYCKKGGLITANHKELRD